MQINHNEWQARARYSGFERVEAVRVAGGWRLIGASGRESLPYVTSRGHPRVWKSLDTLAAFADSLGVDVVVRSSHDLGV